VPPARRQAAATSESATQRSLVVAGVEVVDERVPKFEQSCRKLVQAACFAAEHVEDGEDDGFAVGVELDGPGRAGGERVD
jgi:hypothetical protein